jgi:hypothetical protein
MENLNLPSRVANIVSGPSPFSAQERPTRPPDAAAQHAPARRR